MKKIIIFILAIGLLVYVVMSIEKNTENFPTDEEEVYVLDIERINTYLPGAWQRTTNEKFVRIFRENGVLADMYDGAVRDDEQTWEVVPYDKFTASKESFTTEPYDWYVRISGHGEVLEFILLDVSPERLVLAYLVTGDTLQYRRTFDLK